MRAASGRRALALTEDFSTNSFRESKSNVGCILITEAVGRPRSASRVKSSYAYVAEQNRESERRDILGKRQKVGSGLFVFMGRNSLKRHDPKK
jgi:hypothetical protein